MFSLVAALLLGLLGCIALTASLFAAKKSARLQSVLIWIGIGLLGAACVLAVVTALWLTKVQLVSFWS
jgi:hypothetical protein